MLKSGGSFIDSIRNFPNKVISAGVKKVEIVVKENAPIVAKNMTEKVIKK